MDMLQCKKCKDEIVIDQNKQALVLVMVRHMVDNHGIELYDLLEHKFYSVRPI